MPVSSLPRPTPARPLPFPARSKAAPSAGTSLLRTIACFAILSATGLSQPAMAGPGEDALKSEAGYIVNCSFTRGAHNNGAVREGTAAYGALNNVRLTGAADWVRPGEGAMAMIGLMAATTQLRVAKQPVARYEATIDAFFQTWFLQKRSALCMAPSSPNRGGLAQQLSYDRDGSLKGASLDYNTGVTGAMLCAMWKYHEFNQAAGRTGLDQQWLHGDALSIAWDAGKFLARCRNARYNLLSPSPAGGNLWINDSALATAGLRCLDRWGTTVRHHLPLDKAGTTPGQLADALRQGLESMKDNGATPGFFKYLNPADGSRSYDGSLDQLCFVPYETNALDPAQPFARVISNFWTAGVGGAGGHRMTYQTDQPRQWTYFGTRWHLYDKENVESDRLTPGAGLQLAKVEWKSWRGGGGESLRQRALNRYRFASSSQYSDLWLGAGQRTEAGVGGGIVDWRRAPTVPGQSAAQSEHAPDWQRYIDTSAYFIEVTLMTYWNQDTRYTPN